MFGGTVERLVAVSCILVTAALATISLIFSAQYILGLKEGASTALLDPAFLYALVAGIGVFAIVARHSQKTGQGSILDAATPLSFAIATYLSGIHDNWVAIFGMVTLAYAIVAYLSDRSERS